MGRQGHGGLRSSRGDHDDIGFFADVNASVMREVQDPHGCNLDSSVPQDAARLYGGGYTSCQQCNDLGGAMWVLENCGIYVHLPWTGRLGRQCRPLYTWLVSGSARSLDVRPALLSANLLCRCECRRTQYGDVTTPCPSPLNTGRGDTLRSLHRRATNAWGRSLFSRSLYATSAWIAHTVQATRL